MAIKFINGLYYKINMEKSYIAPHGVMIALDVYGNEESRMHEKARQTDIDLLLEKIGEELGKRFQSINAVISELGITESEILDEMGNIKSAYSKLVPLHKKYLDLASDMHAINANAYVCVAPETRFNISSLKELSFLKVAGFKEEWLTNPIIRCGTDLINAQEIGDRVPSFDYAEFYRMLKPKLIDCVDA